MYTKYCYANKQQGLPLFSQLTVYHPVLYQINYKFTPMMGVYSLHIKFMYGRANHDDTRSKEIVLVRFDA